MDRHFADVEVEMANKHMKNLFNILSCKGKAHYNYPEIAPHLSQNEYTPTNHNSKGKKIK
jgi:hypothetical protein